MTAILVSFIGILCGLVGRLPDLSVDNGILSSMTGAMGTILDWIKACNFFIPLDQILIIFGLVYTIRYGKFLLFIINWIIRRIGDIIP